MVAVRPGPKHFEVANGMFTTHMVTRDVAVADFVRIRVRNHRNSHSRFRGPPRCGSTGALIIDPAREGDLIVWVCRNTYYKYVRAETSKSTRDGDRHAKTGYASFR